MCAYKWFDTAACDTLILMVVALLREFGLRQEERRITSSSGQRFSLLNGRPFLMRTHSHPTRGRAVSSTVGVIIFLCSALISVVLGMGYGISLRHEVSGILVETTLTISFRCGGTRAMLPGAPAPRHGLTHPHPFSGRLAFCVFASNPVRLYGRAFEQRRPQRGNSL